MASRTRRLTDSFTPLAAAGFFFILVAAGLAFLGQRISGPFTGGAVAALGAATAIGGAHSVATRQHRAGDRRGEQIRDHTGPAAVLFGVAFIAPGVAMIVGGLIEAFGNGDRLRDWAGDHVGLIVIGVGAWIVVYGLATLISRWTYLDAPTVWWQRIPGRLLGIWLMLLGAAVAAGGQVLATSDDDPEDALQRLADWITALLS